jgi:hypothetical protein
MKVRLEDREKDKVAQIGQAHPEVEKVADG